MTMRELQEEMIVTLEQVNALKAENEQLRAENLRLRSVKPASYAIESSMAHRIHDLELEVDRLQKEIVALKAHHLHSVGFQKPQAG